MTTAAPERARALYVHVPFCLRRCRYCDFASGVYDRFAASDYVDALARELDSVAEGPFETIYVGGGTPTVLEHDRLSRLLGMLAPRLDAAAACEFTVEANPGTLDRAKAFLMRAAGVNRVSLGVQSFSDAHLAQLGRVHTAAGAREAFGLLREAGFANLSVDIMLALPDIGGPPPVESDLASAVGLGPEHVSAYVLTVEPGTELKAMIESGTLREAGEERQAREYSLACERLGEAGYARYEISNFARPGFESRHNSVYWSGGEYVGVGASAASFTEGLRRTNTRDAADYVARIRKGSSPVVMMERLDAAAAAREALVLGLRTAAGVEAESFRSRTGRSLRELAGGAIESMKARCLLEESGGRLRLTPRGFLVADTVMAELV